MLACLAAGAGYAWLLYSKDTPWGRTWNLTLAGIRAVVVAFIAFLLLGPVLRYIQNTPEAPTVVLAVDDSQSVGLYTDKAILGKLKTGLAGLTDRLRAAGTRVEVRTLDPGRRRPALDSIRYRQPTTDLDRLLSGIRSDYENRNLAATVLVSDGIVNQGRSPVYDELPFAVHAVAVGDTVPKRDVALSALDYNKVAFSGDRFPVVAEVRNDGFRTGAATAVLREGAREISRQTITLDGTKLLQSVTFQVTAPAPGKRRYTVAIEPVAGEFTRLNNARDAYVDVVKGRLKILVAAAGPHPDVNALRAALATNPNFETDLYLPGVKPLKSAAYDAVVLHQLPAVGGAGAEVIDVVRRRRLPTLYILGAQSDFGAFNQLGAGLSVSPRGQQLDEVTAAPNAAFKRFDLTEALSKRVRDYPPATVPFADFRLSPAADVLLWQQVGRVPTAKPLLVTQTRAGQRTAVLAGENTWQWRLAEAAAHDNQPEAYDRVINGVVGLLTAADNKQKLRVFPRRDELTTADDVVFGVEAYNALFERAYGQSVTVTLTDEKNRPRTFSFVNAEGAPGLTVGSLPAGLYRYSARATVEGRPETASGEIFVRDLQLEALTARADHNLLSQLARRSGGQLFYPDQLAALEKTLLAAKFPAVLHADEQLRDLINLRWLFFTLLALLTVEWAARKYLGGY
ncbi:MAG: VWA domain-containing protein [Hymenobacteraceae bacterium]|nr:VWA domain-containing protein [Hymenobacteraceae bacterium]